MQTESFDATPVVSSHVAATPTFLSKTFSLAPLALIVTGAAALRLSNLESLGYVNHYYAAAITSMLQSWHNFLFVAAEPGASVTVDKPPLGLWIEAASAYLLGINTLGLLLPEILCGLASIVLLYHLVQRSFGRMAALLAATALAITPVVVAVDRNNTIDSILIVTLLLAAWAFIRATESGRLRFLLLGALILGLGFNIKMLEAFLPLPAFYALYFLGAKQPIIRKVINLTIATTLLVIVSLFWAVAIDMVPADQRPFIGSSGNNTVTQLILGYNGVERLTGLNLGSANSARGGRGSGGRSFGPLPAQGGLPTGVFRREVTTESGMAQTQPPINAGNNSGAPRNPFGGNPLRGASSGRNVFGGNPSGSNRFGASSFGGVGFGGFGFGASNLGRAMPSGTGRAGLWRLFLPPLSKEASWLLPMALLAMAMLALHQRWQWPLLYKHQALVLWGGWLLTAMVFFSIAQFYHEYYLSMIAAPLAALVGIAAHELWSLLKIHPWRAFALLTFTVVTTLALQLNTVSAFIGGAWWAPLLGILLIFGIGLLILAIARGAFRPNPAIVPMTVSLSTNKGAGNHLSSNAARLGFSSLVAVLLVTPAMWSTLTMLHPSDNQSLPSAYSGAGSTGPVNKGGLVINNKLLNYLQANSQDTRYLMAVPSSMQGSDYVLATDRPVLYLGGFMGIDEVESADDLTRLVANGDLRYVYWNSSDVGAAKTHGARSIGGGMEGNAEVSTWIATHCTALPGYETVTRNAGAPDGTRSALPVAPFGPFGDMQIMLYQCTVSKIAG